MISKRAKVESTHQPTLFELEKLLELTSTPQANRPFFLPDIFLGTSSFTAAGSEGSFYPIGMRSKDFLRHYSSQFQTVEIDSTFYGTPAASTVPQVITHAKGISCWLNLMIEKYFNCTRP